MTEGVKQYEPIFGAWSISKLLGEGSFGKVYEIERKELNTTFRAALKYITIPSNQSEIKSLMADGMDEKSVKVYLEQFVSDVVGEFVLMSKLKGNSNVVSYEDHQVIEHKESIGWDIIIRMELLTNLIDHITSSVLGVKDVIKLGIDICRALELCQRHNIIHRDIKPENIFISDNGDYKLGDFGIARQVEKTTSGLSKKGTYTYMAPEVYKGEAYGSSVDIYSLGIVMYRLLNKNRTPFLPDYDKTKQITHNDRDQSLIKRMSGEKIPMPCGTDGRLAEIVLKACEYKPKDRYSSPTQMKEDLEAILYDHMESRVIYPNGDRLDIHSLDYAQTGASVCDGADDNRVDVIEKATTSSEFASTPIEKEAVSDEFTREGTTSEFVANPVESEMPEGTYSDFGKKTVAAVPAKMTLLEKLQNLNRWVLAGACIAVILVMAGVAWWAITPKTVPIAAIVNVEDAIRLAVGDTYMIEADVEPSNASVRDINYKSSIPAIASVSNNGEIKAVSVGRAPVVVSVGDKEKIITVDVREPGEVEFVTGKCDLDDLFYARIVRKDGEILTAFEGRAYMQPETAEIYQIMRFEKMSNGTYTIKSIIGDYNTLTVLDDSTEKGAKVFFSLPRESESQNWRIDRIDYTSPDNAYVLGVQCAPLYIFDSKAENFDDGNEIWLFERMDNNFQVFTIEKVAEPVLEWRLEGYEDVEPYNEFEMLWLNGAATGQIRHTGNTRPPEESAPAQTTPRRQTTPKPQATPKPQQQAPATQQQAPVEPPVQQPQSTPTPPAPQGDYSPSGDW